ncbi:MAG TPA: hypothetical protein VLW26_09820 [Steroidobacteraceae bacterium]|nr:hypothetical protein [Steroidobacteraceae bacterium]
MLILKKLPRSHALHEPIRHDGSHPRPVSRRDFISAGFLQGSAVVVGSSALAGMLMRSGLARASNLAPDIKNLQSNLCGIATQGAGKIPFICFDLAGGANLNGSEVLIGGKGGQLDFLSTAGYGKLGIPGNMLPNSPNPGSANNDFIDTSLGLAWHSDGGILRGIHDKSTPAAQANTNGAAIAALSQNDTQNNPHNPMYGIWKAGAGGSLLTLIGTQNSDSGGNSMAPAALIDLSERPTVVQQASDVTGLVDTGQLGTMFTGPSGPADTVNVLESITRISGGNDTSNTGSKLGDVTVQSNSASADTQLKTSLQCGYVKSAVLVDQFGDPSSLNPDLDTDIVGQDGSSIFTQAEYTGNSNFRKTAAVMKMVISGYAGAGTITLGGYDYHDGTRATGEARNFQAGQCIGACLEYAKRKGLPLMVYVFSDGSLSSTGMVDNSTGGRGKFGWQGDNQSTAATFFLVYNPAGRAVLFDGGGGTPAVNHQQIGYYTTDGSVASTSSPAANAVNLLVNTVILNYMALHGDQGNFSTLFPNNGLGNSTMLDSLTAFTPIVNHVIT